MTPPRKPQEVERPHRRALSLSEIVERLLARSTQDHSSITLSRNAKGETQIEVVVRSASEGEINTASEAAREAIRLFDTLRARYPMADGLTGAHPIEDEHRV